MQFVVIAMSEGALDCRLVDNAKMALHIERRFREDARFERTRITDGYRDYTIVQLSEMITGQLSRDEL